MHVQESLCLLLAARTNTIPQTSLGKPVFPCRTVCAQLSSCAVNARLLQPYSSVKVGEGAGESKRLFCPTSCTLGFLEHFIRKTALLIQSVENPLV